MGKKNDMYNEIVNLKRENEKLRNMLEKYQSAEASSSASDTSVIDDAEFEDVNAKATDDSSSKIIELATKYAEKLGLDEDDLKEVQKEVAKATEAERKKCQQMLEAKLVHKRASDRLSDIVSMELSGKKPKDILAKLYADDASNKKENAFVDKLSAKLRANDFATTIRASSMFGGF